MTAEQILADIAAKFARETWLCDVCPAGGVHCSEADRSCGNCEFRDHENDECDCPEDQECPERENCAANLLKYAQQASVREA